MLICSEKYGVHGGGSRPAAPKRFRPCHRRPGSWRASASYSAEGRLAHAPGHSGVSSRSPGPFKRSWQRSRPKESFQRPPSTSPPRTASPDRRHLARRRAMPRRHYGSEEKLEVAERSTTWAIDVIEAGLPITSEGDFQAVERDREALQECRTAGLSRAQSKDIDRCAEAVNSPGAAVSTPSSRPRRCTCASSEHTPEQVTELSTANVTRARNRSTTWNGRPKTPPAASGLSRRTVEPDQGRRHHHQYPRYRRLCRSRAIRRGHPPSQAARARHR